MPRRFDIVENVNKSKRDLYPFLRILQHDHVTSIQSVVVAPLVRAGSGPASGRLHPILELEGQNYVVLIEDLGSMARSRLGRVVGSAESRHYEIIAALDMLFTGI
jgi:toxin CcdB